MSWSSLARHGEELLRLLRRFDPDQPRWPAKAPGGQGGRWVGRVPLFDLAARAAVDGVPEQRLTEAQQWASSNGVSLILTDAMEQRLAGARLRGLTPQWLAEFRRQHRAIFNRVAQDALIDRHWEFEVEQSYDFPPGVSLDDAKEMAVARLREVIDGKPVVVRQRGQSRLRKALADGRLKTQFETGTSSGLLDSERRANFEELTFGLPHDLDPRQRPVYGHVATMGVEPADTPSPVSDYGDIQIVLRDEVKRRTTVSIGDSLDDAEKVRPAPLLAPDWQATRAILWNEFVHTGSLYIETQVHGGVTWDDVEEVVFADQPEPATVDALETAGVSWRVLR